MALARWKRAVAAAGGPFFEYALDARDRLRCLRAKSPCAPFGTDGVGYEALVGFLRRRRIVEHVPGELIEIGTRFGGGALKLSRWLERAAPSRRLYVVDTFALDWQRGCGEVDDLALPGLRRRYGALSQRAVFDRVCGGRPNVVVLPFDSAKVSAPGVLCFGFVDGNHEPRYVESDWALVWSALAPGGAIALHDYRYYQPQVTKTIDALVAKHRSEIAEVEVDERKHILFALKKR